MPIHAIEKIFDGSGVEIGVRLLGVGPDDQVEVLYADIPGNSWNQNRLNKFVERAQQLIDKRTPLADLDDLDPDKTIDPGLPYLFHDGSDLVCRMITISDAVFDGTLRFRLQRNN